MSTLELPWGLGEITAEGGSTPIALAALGTILVTAIVGSWLVLRFYRGYRQTGERASLLLAGGILLVAPVQMLVRAGLATFGGSLLTTHAAAFVTQTVGLGLILSAIYGSTKAVQYESRQTSGYLGVIPLLILLPGGILNSGIGSDSVLIVFFDAVIVIAGIFVALQAFRGYRYYGSMPMLYLSIGIVLLTVVSAVISNLLWFGTLWFGINVPAAGAILIIMITDLLGLLSISYSLTRA